jgi:crossover junction endodeoxyribonuclease RuvC
MIILGIDPGSRITGFGVVEWTGDSRESSHDSRIVHRSHGVIVLDGEMNFARRMKELGEALASLLAKYKPRQVVIEKIFLGKNADSAFKLGHARGVAMYEAARAEAEVIEYATRVVKKGIVGNGGASKEDVQNCLQRLLKLKNIERLDASDALALATFQAYQLMNPLVSSRPDSQENIL